MRKYICLVLALFTISILSAKAYEYKLYNPQTRETTNAQMMTVDTSHGDNSYYIGLYTYNLYCLVDKKVKINRKGLKHGVCYPIDPTDGRVEPSRKLPKWQEIKYGTFDKERSDIKFEKNGMSEVEFEFNN